MTSKPAVSKSGLQQLPSAAASDVSDKARRPRRGWREKIEPGLYRNHRVGCRATISRKPGVRCTCPFQAHLPTGVPGRTSPQNLTATTIRDAREEKERRQRQARRRRGANGSAHVSVTEFFAEFLGKHQLRPATRRNYERIFRRLHEPVIGHLPLAAVNEEHVSELIRHLEIVAERRREATGKRNSSWIAQQLIPLQSAFSTAVRWRRIPESPLRYPSLPDISPKREGEIDANDDPKAILSSQQVELLCAVAAGGADPITALRDASLIRTAYEFALRNSEARGLKWSDVDFAGQRISVVRQIDPVAGIESLTKGKRVRHLPGPESAFELLERWQFQCQANAVASETPGSEYVWRGANPARPMPIAMPNRRVQAAEKRAGLVNADGKALIVFHGLRHSRASHLLLDAAPLLEVSRFLGHSTQMVTAIAYSHLVPEDEFAAIRQLFVAVPSEA